MFYDNVGYVKDFIYDKVGDVKDMVYYKVDYLNDFVYDKVGKIWFIRSLDMWGIFFMIRLVM